MVCRKKRNSEKNNILNKISEKLTNTITILPASCRCDFIHSRMKNTGTQTTIISVRHLGEFIGPSPFHPETTSIISIAKFYVYNEKRALILMLFNYKRLTSQWYFCKCYVILSILFMFALGTARGRLK